jgi:hypothetical protein
MAVGRCGRPLEMDRIMNLISNFNKETAPFTPQEQDMMKREIESTDRAIDRLAYELYGLSLAEINIVEGKESKK